MVVHITTDDATRERARQFIMTRRQVSIGLLGGELGFGLKRSQSLIDEFQTEGLISGLIATATTMSVSPMVSWSSPSQVPALRSTSWSSGESPAWSCACVARMSEKKNHEAENHRRFGRRLMCSGASVGRYSFPAAHEMIAAAEAGNDDDVFADFDIAKVRENLRPILTATARPDKKDVDGSLAGGLELLATPRLVATMLDTMQTPQRLGDLVRYGVMAKPDPVPPRNYAEQYESPNVFVLEVTPGDHRPANSDLSERVSSPGV